MKRKAVFLDRDGTIIREANYLSDPNEVELLDGAAKGIQALSEAGYLIIVTTNQSGVARGYFDEETVHAVNDRMRVMLKDEGAKVDAVYYCPHHTKGDVEHYRKECNCRKPMPGMIEQAIGEHHIDPYQSWVVGDKEADVVFGKNKDCRTVLVLTGYGEKTRAKGFDEFNKPTMILSNLGAAAQAIIASGQRD